VIAHKDAPPPSDPKKEDDKKQAEVVPSPSPVPAPIVKPKINIRLESGGFQSEQSKPGAQTLAGTSNVACGRPDMTVSPSNPSIGVDQELAFTWDATTICLGMTIETPSGNISFSKQSEQDDLPAAWGKGFASFSAPGFYSGKLTYQGTCNNNGRL
jgi:hypothetical protein